MNQLRVNYQYKDRLFRFLFGNEEYKEFTLSLYNTLNGSHYEDVSDLEFTTIEDVIYMGMKNDVSFIVGFDMPLYEHQSTFNPNMPVRGLMYYGRLYDQYLSAHHCNRYGEKLIKLPTPSNIVFYNGIKELDDVVNLRLSDAFIGDKKVDGYEWTVTMININNGHNQHLMESCKALKDYSIFMGLVREYIPKYGKEQGIDKAVTECIKCNILKEILLKHKAEVKGMCLTEYDELEQIEMERADAREEGRMEGRMEGRLEGILEGRECAIFESVYENDYSAERGADKLNISITVFYSRYNEWKRQNNKE